jgi:hypothetical protein
MRTRLETQAQEIGVLSELKTNNTKAILALLALFSVTGGIASLSIWRVADSVTSYLAWKVSSENWLGVRYVVRISGIIVTVGPAVLLVRVLPCSDQLRIGILTLLIVWTVYCSDTPARGQNIFATATLAGAMAAVLVLIFGRRTILG